MSHPEIFYKYLSPDTAKIVLESSRLRWSSPLSFNDPAEFQRMPRFEPTVVTATKSWIELLIGAARGKLNINKSLLSQQSSMLLVLIRELLNKNISESEIINALTSQIGESDKHIAEGLRDFFNLDFMSSARIICVTTDFSNDAMWAHYANNHKGCVLGFKHIEDLSTPFLAAKKVNYSEHPPIVGSGIDFLLYGHNKELLDATINAVCYTKKSSWQYEQEWRAVTWRQDENDAQFKDYFFYSEELESITLGCKATPETEAIATHHIKSNYKNCKLYRLTSKSGETKRNLIDIT
ncbi:MAG: DUF2971 domain-containing protein [Candidatus Saccharibacteria bacterium]|nr:DUF2971 domain-containing protein [Moraxellaceae bacterium]